MQCTKNNNRVKVYPLYSLLFVIGYFFVSSLFLLEVNAKPLDPQVFIDEYRLNHILTDDDRTYAQLREIAHVLNYEIDFDEANNIVSLYKKSSGKPDIKRESNLYPTNIEELTFDEHKEIIKVYELSGSENPREISRDTFDKNGYRYTFSDVTKSSNESLDTKEHIETIEVATGSKDTNAILSQLEKEMEYETEDGYKGLLVLDIDSIKTDVAGKKTSSYTASENREYPNLSNSDTSLVPKTIQAKGMTLKLANVNWKESSKESVDYDEVTTTYTAVANYTGTGSKTNVTGYVITANYVGEVSKTLEGKTIYTAYFVGELIEKPKPKPTPKPVEKKATIEELENQLADMKEKEKAKYGNKGMAINPLYIIVPIGSIGLVSLLAYLLFLRKNVIIYSLRDGDYQQIGKVRLSVKKPIIDLTQFISEVISPDFNIVLEKAIARKADDEVLTINYGDESLQHIVVYDDTNKDYQFEVKF